MPTAKRKKLTVEEESPSSPLSSRSANSLCDSNDFDVSLLNFFEMSDKKYWLDWEEDLFIRTYVEWQKNGKWEATRSTLANHTAMAAYLTQECGVPCTGTQSQSKFYRVVEKWRLFTHLRGDSAKVETGIGWDEEHRCFVTGVDQWAYLYQLNRQYLDFQHPYSADWMILWDEVMDGKQATKNRARSSTQPPPQYVPPRVRRHRDDPTGKGKGKGVASSSVINPPLSFVSSEGDGSPAPTKLGKRPMGRSGCSSGKEGSKGSESRKTGSENYQEALSHFSRFSSIVSHEREAQEKYSIEVAKTVVEGLKLEKRLHMFLLRELLNAEFRALFLSFTEAEQMTWIELFIVPKLEGK